LAGANWATVVGTANATTSATRQHNAS
jgi:3-keto-L-gulonate-6-phosphate decarboxylase